MIAAHFGEKHISSSMLESYQECLKIKELVHSDVKVCKGAQKAITDQNNYEYSEGADLIIQEAFSDSSEPLFVIFLGPLTDLACAYLKEPRIADRLTAIWVGGGPYPNGGKEFNMYNDIAAANIIFQSAIDLWQIPSNVYSQLLVSLSELQMRVAPCGKLGEYLFHQLVEFNESSTEFKDWPSGESWCLGDSSAIGLLLDQHLWAYEIKNAPLVDKEMNYIFQQTSQKLRVYHTINSRFILEDFFIKLKLFTGKPNDF